MVVSVVGFRIYVDHIVLTVSRRTHGKFRHAAAAHCGHQPRQLGGTEGTCESQGLNRRIIALHLEPGDKVVPILARHVIVGAEQRGSSAQGLRIAGEARLEVGPQLADLGIELAALLNLKILFGITPGKQRQAQRTGKRDPGRPQTCPEARRTRIRVEKLISLH